MSRETIELTQDLIRKESVTPEDGGCQQLIASRLEAIGFHCEAMEASDVKNAWIRRGKTVPVFVSQDIPMLCRQDHWTLGSPTRLNRLFETVDCMGVGQPT